MTRDELTNIAVDATNDAELISKDIPAIDLYVDQIINLISSKLSEGSERHRSRVLTKTMINNYSKDGIIMPVKGKKYTREQVMQILFIYSLKSTLSIGEIKRLLYGAYESDGFGAAELTALYDKHEDIKSETRDYALHLLNDGILEHFSLDPENDSDYVSTICALVATSAHLKNIAQAMIDAKFPEPPEESSDEKDKEKEKKREEKEKSKEEKSKEKSKEKEDKTHSGRSSYGRIDWGKASKRTGNQKRRHKKSDKDIYKQIEGKRRFKNGESRCNRSRRRSN